MTGSLPPDPGFYSRVSDWFAFLLHTKASVSSAQAVFHCYAKPVRGPALCDVGFTRYCPVVAALAKGPELICRIQNSL